MDLPGKVIVVTDAAQGLGRKMAEMMAGQGAKLGLAELDHVKLQDTVQLCAKAGTKELARHKIRVAGIAPGFFETRMVTTIPQKIKDSDAR